MTNQDAVTPESDRVYDPSNPEHLAWWRETVRQQVLDAYELPEGLALAWDDTDAARRRCTSEACNEYDGIHSYGDGCAMARTGDGL